MMSVASAQPTEPLLARFERLVSLDAPARSALKAALAARSCVAAHREIQAEGEPISVIRIIVTGWAAQVRQFRDGRRQFIRFLLPGDMVGLCGQPEPVATSTIVALTAVELCAAPSPSISPSLDDAYSMSGALHDAYLLEQIGRLGQFSALERIISVLLELDERLTLNGMAKGGKFATPLTQEMLGDALGLTPVHTNRMLQQARRNGYLTWQGGQVSLNDPRALAHWLGRQPSKVSAAAHFPR